ncbi:hypothetical protein B0T22DRAFT_203032 [Podospora appendiculata]|uniref:Uncharacterized protein n=1 Tax=Podospora appendiculata TaxID=314037 RepID=A0AAE0X4B6_9PEZI|nr:hypothetical protein B0T22DRAFT_203032 [Podospora appendiculata]
MAWADGASDGLQRIPVDATATPSSTMRIQENSLVSGSASSHCLARTTKIRRDRRKKAVLVDLRRKEATVTFLKRVEAARLRRSNGAREYVPVYDWRVLEVLRTRRRSAGDVKIGMGHGLRWTVPRAFGNGSGLGCHDYTLEWRHGIGGVFVCLSCVFCGLEAAFCHFAFSEVEGGNRRRFDVIAVTIYSMRLPRFIHVI